MSDQHQPTNGGQEAPHQLTLQQLQAANYYANMPLESPLFLPIMPVGVSTAFKHDCVDLDCSLTWAALPGPARAQVEPSPTTGIQHLIPPLFQGNTARQVVAGGRDAGIAGAQLPSPVRARLCVGGALSLHTCMLEGLGTFSKQQGAWRRPQKTHHS